MISNCNLLFKLLVWSFWKNFPLRWCIFATTSTGKKKRISQFCRHFKKARPIKNHSLFAILWLALKKPKDLIALILQSRTLSLTLVFMTGVKFFTDLKIYLCRILRRISHGWSIEPIDTFLDDRQFRSRCRRSNIGKFKGYRRNTQRVKWSIF